MKYVHIVSFDPVKETAKTVATCALPEGAGSVECTGDTLLVIELGGGVFSPLVQRTVTPEDGIEFLLALKSAYKHPSLFATDVIEGDAIEPYELPPARKPDEEAA